MKQYITLSCSFEQGNRSDAYTVPSKYQNSSNVYSLPQFVNATMRNIKPLLDDEKKRNPGKSWQYHVMSLMKKTTNDIVIENAGTHECLDLSRSGFAHWKMEEKCFDTFYIHSVLETKSAAYLKGEFFHPKYEEHMGSVTLQIPSGRYAKLTGGHVDTRKPFFITGLYYRTMQTIPEKRKYSRITRHSYVIEEAQTKKVTKLISGVAYHYNET